METNVGSLRQQSALSDSARPVVIVTDDLELAKALGYRRLVVEEFYPDGNGSGIDGKQPSFKIKVRLAKE